MKRKRFSILNQLEVCIEASAKNGGAISGASVRGLHAVGAASFVASGAGVVHGVCSGGFDGDYLRGHLPENARSACCELCGPDVFYSGGRVVQRIKYVAEQHRANSVTDAHSYTNRPVFGAGQTDDHGGFY